MAKDFNHECIICGQKFTACNNCVKLHTFEEYDKFNMNEYCEKHNITGEEKYQMFLGFRAVCDTFNHYLIFQIIRKLKKNEITPLQAKIELEVIGFGVNEIQSFKESVKEYLITNVFFTIEAMNEIQEAMNEIQEENNETSDNTDNAEIPVVKEERLKTTRRKRTDVSTQDL